MTRRMFNAAAAAAPLSALLAQERPRKPLLCIFSKHMAQFGWAELGKMAKSIGFAGVDLTVREKGHVLPARAAEDLPKAVEGIRRAGVEVPMITTNLLTAEDPTAVPILSTAGKLKIPYFKLGYHRYRGGTESSLEAVMQATAGLARLAKQYGVEAGFHNHSGDYVGEAVWDIRAVIASMEPKWIGYYFDPGHATVEGGLGGWKQSLDLVLPRLKMVALKDFYWAKKNGKWQVEWCALGRGMVDFKAIFSRLAAAKFAGPVSLHVEYHTSDELAAIKQDFEYMKSLVAGSYPS